ncbi:ATP-binding protein [Streptomyces sp. NPDC006743]|uniref:ATP-binding protein n=1 Tax=Streptomyces sp. NPDC006743 TaxID=3154480 RepID=UPI003453AACD
MTVTDQVDAEPAAAPAAALLDRLAALRDRVALLVGRRSADDPTATDPLRGLYLSDDAVRHLLRPDRSAAGLPAGPVTGDGPGHAGEAGDRLAGLAARCGLGDLDTALLLVALAPDLDRSFEPLYGYLNDDVSRRRATVALALDLCGAPVHSASARSRLHPTAPLTALGLLVVEEPERPFLSRSLRVPDRLVAHLLGDDTPDAALAGHLRSLPEPPWPHSTDGGAGGGTAGGSFGGGDGGAAGDTAGADTADGTEVTRGHGDPGGTDGEFVRLARRLGARLAAGPPLTAYLRESREGDALTCAAAALRTAGLAALHFTGPEDHVPDLLREARLSGGVVVVSALPEHPAGAVRMLAAATDVPVLITGSRPYDPLWSDGDLGDPLVLEVPGRRAGSLRSWSAALGEEPGFDLAATVAPYHLADDRIARAARTARALAAFDGVPLSPAHLRVAARRQSASGLEQHARRIRPAVDWGDLVLPERPLTQLHELALRARHRDRVLGDWRLSAGGGRGRGVLGLFAGESGTGKTLSAEVVAAELGLDLYVVQLSSIVDKYVGETEKNLERIFTEADRTDAVLLFDEADAVFGKRSEVKDSHDRYANMESAYLLQRLESFDGIALLTTNLRANIDEAFTRRLDLVVDFPFPDARQRLALWQHSLSHVPCAEGIELGPVVAGFELAGGSIRSAVVTAAYLAAGRDGLVTSADVLEGARREYRKAGRLLPDEGSW